MRWGHRIVVVAAIAVFWWVASEADRLSTFSVLALPIAGLAVVSISILRTIDESDGLVIRGSSSMQPSPSWRSSRGRTTHPLTRVMVAESCLRSAHDGDTFDCGGWTGSVTVTTDGWYYDIDDAAADLVLSPDTPTPSPVKLRTDVPPPLRGLVPPGTVGRRDQPVQCRRADHGRDGGRASWPSHGDNGVDSRPLTGEHAWGRPR